MMRQRSRRTQPSIWALLRTTGLALLVLVGSAVLPPGRPAHAVEIALGSPIAVGTAPFGVAADGTTNKIYVINQGDSSVSVLDGTTQARLDPPIAVGTHPQGIAVDPTTHRIYVANTGADTVSVIDGT